MFLNTIRFVSIVSSLFLFIACGGSDGGSNTLTVGKSIYYIPDGVNVINAKIEGADATLISAGEKEELVGFIQNFPLETEQSKTLNDTKHIEKNSASFYRKITANSGTIRKLSLLSSQNFTNPYTFNISHYKIVTYQNMKPLTLASQLIKSDNREPTLPIAHENAPSSTTFRLIFLTGIYEGSTFNIAVVVSEEEYAKYETTSTSITNAARVIPQGKSLNNSVENFTTNKGSENADFLFVIDDSGSMSDNQDALSKAAIDFTSEMSQSGLQYRSAIITTSSGADNAQSGDANRILRETGIIENDDTLLKEKLIAGTHGSGTETGIWNAEQVLQPTGAVTQLGMPKSATTLSVIIISDEDSQYKYRPEYVDFNVTNNLFIDRKIKVYSIIQAGYGYGSTGIFDEYHTNQYDDLSISTGGMYADIENRGANNSLDYSVIMKQIAQDAGGTASSFVLSHIAISIQEVKVNEKVISLDTINGYTYLQGSQSIVFHGTSIPKSEAKISVEYRYYV